jgi:hypothetical protein
VSQAEIFEFPFRRCSRKSTHSYGKRGALLHQIDSNYRAPCCAKNLNCKLSEQPKSNYGNCFAKLCVGDPASVERYSA